ncbi:MAG: stage V sporulation protein S [Anaerolineae bacterium]|nr:stage V sporulation protein S [Anaerolineae bacterium]
MSDNYPPDPTDTTGRKPLRVGAGSNPNDVAGAIANTVRQDGAVDVHAIGAHAVNQALKAVIIAMDYLDQRGGLRVSVVPSFVKLDVGDGQKTAIRLAIDVVPSES